jgi:hypothetical protein
VPQRDGVRRAASARSPLKTPQRLTGDDDDSSLRGERTDVGGLEYMQIHKRVGQDMSDAALLRLKLDPVLAF